MRLKLRAAIVIRASTEDVFNFVAIDHLVNHHRWDADVLGTTPVERGPLQLGSRFDLTRHTLGRVETRRFEITEWQAPTRMAIETRSKSFDLTLTSDFVAVGDNRTELSLSADARIDGPRRLVAPLMRFKFSSDLHRNLATIKSLIETDPQLRTRFEAAV